MKLGVIDTGSSSLYSAKSPNAVLVGLLVMHVVLTILYTVICFKMVKKLATLVLATLTNVAGAFSVLGGTMVASVAGGHINGRMASRDRKRVG